MTKHVFKSPRTLASTEIARVSDAKVYWISTVLVPDTAEEYAKWKDHLPLPDDGNYETMVFRYKENGDVDYDELFRVQERGIKQAQLAHATALQMLVDGHIDE